MLTFMVETFSNESGSKIAIEVSFPENWRDRQGSKIKELVETLELSDRGSAATRSSRH